MTKRMVKITMAFLQC